MAKAKNRVIAGDFINQTVNGALGYVSIMKSFGKEGRDINKDTVQTYKLVTNENYMAMHSLGRRGWCWGVCRRKTMGFAQSRFSSRMERRASLR